MSESIRAKERFEEGILTVIRTSSLLGKVDPNAFVEFISREWETLHTAGRWVDEEYLPGDLDLEPMYNALVAMPGVDAQEAAWFCLFLKSRELRFNLTLQLPHDVECLPPHVKEGLMARTQRAGAQSGLTFATPSGAATAAVLVEAVKARR